jgi:hypothetical protein
LIDDIKKRKEEKIKDDLHWHRKIVSEVRSAKALKDAKTLDQILYRVNFPGARGAKWEKDYAHERALKIIRDRVYADDDYNIITWFNREAKGRRLYDLTSDVDAFITKFRTVTKVTKAWKYKIYAAWRRHMLKLAAKLSQKEGQAIRAIVKECDEMVGW